MKGGQKNSKIQPAPRHVISFLFLNENFAIQTGYSSIIAWIFENYL
uniref:Uncharacterized protein n=1 Tax=uncultured alpha proteobacterium HF0130_20P23 TaxID=710809 RepID=E0XTA0_9PROT|nr:hypothetical protein [uncultured alpha proteobacterium HF0130_20P23]